MSAPWTDAGLLELFRTRREKRLSEERTSYPARNPIASDLHDCRRYMVLRQVAWQVRPPFPVSALETMENGNVAERAILDQLRREGWEVIREQEPFEILQPIEAGGARRRVLAGKADAMFALDRETLPVDVKERVVLHDTLQLALLDVARAAIAFLAARERGVADDSHAAQLAIHRAESDLREAVKNLRTLEEP